MPQRDGFHNHQSHPEAFPRLSEKQLRTLERHGTCRRYAAGGVLFEQGDTDFGFFVILEGHVRILQRTADGDRDFAEHGPGEFTGDLAMLTRTAAIGAAVAREPSKVLCLDADTLRKVVADEPELSEIILHTFLLRRSILEQTGYDYVKLIGSRWSPPSNALKDFLARNRLLYQWIDPETDPTTDALLHTLHVSPKDLPVVLIHPDRVLRQPTIETLATALGLRTTVDETVVDLAVVGAGPGGLAAAVYGASEGLKTLLIESTAPGGQAGTSSRIENYLGFPTGVSGADLASRALTQAQKFGAVVASPCTVTNLGCDGHYKVLDLSTGGRALARAVVIATGAHYRRLPVENLRRFEGSACMYAATAIEARLCSDAEVIVVGGGNSAGQAAVYLSEHAQRVWLVVRGPGLAETMSRYLIDRIENTANITLLTETQIADATGAERLEHVALRSKNGDLRTVPAAAVFVMIGAEPCTDWLGGCIGLNRAGFIVTGLDAVTHPDFESHWHADRTPYYLETTRPAVFAVGDVRAQSVKRVASAVGEGSMVVRYVHDALA